MADEILAVRFHGNQVVTIAREEVQTEEITYTPCDSLADALAVLAAHGQYEPEHTVTAEPRLAPGGQVERKVVSAGGYGFGITVQRS